MRREKTRRIRLRNRRLDERKRYNGQRVVKSAIGIRPLGGR